MNTPRAWATVDLGAVKHNTRFLDQTAGNAELCAVVKANGYGHGAARVAAAVLEAGATRLGVAQVQEAAVLRAAGITAPILVLSEPSQHEFRDATELNLEVAAYSEAGIAAAIDADVPVHLKVDTGMHRSGCSVDDLLELARRSEPVSVFTHLAVADEPDNPYTNTQLDRFDNAVGLLEAEVLGRHSYTQQTRREPCSTSGLGSTWSGAASASTGSPRVRTRSASSIYDRRFA